MPCKEKSCEGYEKDEIFEYDEGMHNEEGSGENNVKRKQIKTGKAGLS